MLGYLFRIGCKIPLMIDIDPEHIAPLEKEERSWLPWVTAVVIVLLVAFGVILGLEHRNAQNKHEIMPVSTPLDPYAGSLPLTRLAMSESSNLVGGKVTYLDGHIANQGTRTVTGITVQVLFRNAAHEVTQNESQSLKFIRMREPYIDVEAVSAAPLRPGGERDFRVIFDAVTPDWDRAYPEIRILRVETK
jgi:hypothetical protein